ncbi:MAG: hypothetical protein GY777_11860 [Candidatus Brocadiaceae bacterium]|nr:hypothetical protein [Candidatus Brocadiaceae bacterium]
MKNVEPKKGGVLFIGGNAQILISKDAIVGTRGAEDQKMREERANKESHLTIQTIRLASK